MKTISISIYAALLFSIFSINFAHAQTAIKETIPVSGNCGMCKSTIEKAARSAGANTASWSEDSKQLKVTYLAKKTSAAKIQQAVANAGYDTRDFKADDTAYEKLHACCQYDRKPVAVAMKCCDNEKCGSELATCKDNTACKDKACCKM